MNRKSRRSVANVVSNKVTGLSGKFMFRNKSDGVVLVGHGVRVGN